jgi:superfamily II DNA or RNA helicase
MKLFEEFKEDNNILVYCGATSVEDDDSGELVRQIDLGTKKLQTEFGMSVKRFTAEENLKERQNIKQYFAQGMYQVVTAIKCLDEGVNIPGIKTAFIMSSSRNPKEFVQRRGRLLRKSDNKKKALIFDFITLPRDIENVQYGDIDEDKTILVGEIARMIEFGRLADNPEVVDDLVNQIMTAYDYFFDAEEEMEKMEEYYGE